MFWDKVKGLFYNIGPAGTRAGGTMGGSGAITPQVFGKIKKEKPPIKFSFFTFSPTSLAQPLCFSNFPLSLQKWNQTKRKPKKHKLFDFWLNCLFVWSGVQVLLQSCIPMTPSQPQLPGSPSLTILSASSVQTLHAGSMCIVKYSRPPDFKSFSNVSLPFACTTGPATDPSLP